MQRQEKQAQFQQQKKLGIFPYLVIGIVILGAVGLIGWKATASPDGKYPLLTAEKGMVRLAEKQVNDGKVHFFTYRAAGTNVDFFILKSRDGVIRAAFDTCDVCYREKKGYRQEGDFMVCNNCGQRFQSDLINEVKGGCNPAPLQRVVTANEVRIAAADLADGARYFNWQEK